MGIGISVLLMAVGAILTFAVEAEVSGVSLDTVGVILMIVGAVGLVWAMLTVSTIGPWHRAGARRAALRPPRRRLTDLLGVVRLLPAELDALDLAASTD